MKKTSLNAKFLFLGILFLFCTTRLNSQAVSPFFGHNGWAPNPIGSYDQLLSNGTVYNNSWQLGARMVRLGGGHYDEQFMHLPSIIAIFPTAGLKPILQVPVAYGLAQYWNDPNNPSNASATIMQALNAILVVGSPYEQALHQYVNQYKNDVDYWSIGNEPDIWGKIHGNGGPLFLHANFQDQKANNGGTQVIAKYIKTISEWIRNWDPGCTIVGPDLAYHNWDPWVSLFQQLSDGSAPADNIWRETTPGQGDYVDIFSFHHYAWGNRDANGVTIPWTKADVVQKPFTGGAGSFNSLLSDMQTWLTANNSNSYSKLGITEFNITTRNDDNGDNAFVPGVDDALDGLGCSSFINGQYFAEMMAVGRFRQQWWWDIAMMIPWSVAEGSGIGDLGIVDATSFQKRSSYHHLRIMAREFEVGRVQFLANAASYTNFKAFAVRSCTGAAVVIMNQNKNSSNTPLTYHFNLDGAAPLSANVSGNINMEWNDKWVSSDPNVLTNSLGKIDDMETHVYVLDACGKVKRSYEYNELMYMTAPNPNYLEPVENFFSSATCRCELEDQSDEWYHPGESPYRPASATSVPEGMYDRSDITVMPNPGTDIVTFSGKGITLSGNQLVIYNSAGSKVGVFPTNPGQSELRIDVREFSSGIYFYRLEGDTPSRMRKLVITD